MFDLEVWAFLLDPKGALAAELQSRTDDCVRGPRASNELLIVEQRWFIGLSSEDRFPFFVDDESAIGADDAVALRA